MYSIKKLLTILLILIFFILNDSCLRSKKIAYPPPPPPPPPPIEVVYDGDGDAVPDSEDKCPTVAGLAKYKGCPIPDRDEDGVNDEEDICPDTPGSDQGCPRIVNSSGGYGGSEIDTFVDRTAPIRKINIPDRKFVSQNTVAEPIEVTEKKEKKLPINLGIAHTSNAKMKAGETILIYLRAQLKRTGGEVQKELNIQIDNDKKKGVATGQKQRKSTTDTLNLSGFDSLRVVPDDYDSSIFSITPIYAATQQLDSLTPTNWLWKVYAKKTSKSELIFLKAYGIDKNGDPHSVYIGKIPIAVNAVVFPYAWLAFIAIVIMLLTGFILWFLRRKRKMRQKVFFSYKWDDKELINELYKSLKKARINVIKDKEDLRYRGSITNFMADLGNAKLIIIAVSDKYLKSINCMKELYQIYSNAGMKKEEFQKRIFPIPIDELNLSKPDIANIYIQYWKQEELKWKIINEENKDSINVEHNNEYQFVRRVVNEIGNLIFYLSDINTLTLKEICNNDFAEIKTSVQTAIEKNVDLPEE